MEMGGGVPLPFEKGFLSTQAIIAIMVPLSILRGIPSNLFLPSDT